MIIESTLNNVLLKHAYVFTCRRFVVQVYAFVQVNRHHTKKVQVGKDQEKAQSERDSHSKNRGGKKPN